MTGDVHSFLNLKHTHVLDLQFLLQLHERVTTAKSFVWFEANAAACLREICFLDNISSLIFTIPLYISRSFV
jgi:hypothetical protein